MVLGLGLWCLTPLSTIFKPGVRRENHRPVACQWQTLSHNVVSSSTPRHHELGSTRRGICKSNYHTITTTATPYCLQANKKDNNDKDIIGKTSTWSLNSNS